MSNILNSEASVEEITKSLTRDSIDMWGEERTRELAGSIAKVARDIRLLLQVKLERSDPEPYFPLLVPSSGAAVEASR